MLSRQNEGEMVLSRTGSFQRAWRTTFGKAKWKIEMENIFQGIVIEETDL